MKRKYDSFISCGTHKSQCLLKLQKRVQKSDREYKNNEINEEKV